MHLEQRREVEVKEQAWREVEERPAIERVGVAVKRRERRGQDETKEALGLSTRLAPFRSRSNRNATRPLPGDDSEWARKALSDG